MAYRVTFWRPRVGINVLLPATQPLGEKIRAEVMNGNRSELLDSFPAQEMFEKLRSVFEGSRIDGKGYLHWSDEIDNGFVIRSGEQYVELCSFDMADEDRERVFSIAAEFQCDFYDWEN